MENGQLKLISHFEKKVHSSLCIVHGYLIRLRLRFRILITINYRLSTFFCLLLTAYFLLPISHFPFLNYPAYSAVCVFRFPDRDVFKIFPDANNYISETKKIDKKTKTEIEKFLGQMLDADETELIFFKVLKDRNIIGIIHPHAERGEYGTIEVVWAMDLEGKIIDFIIQRSREKKTKELSSDEFKKQFIGKSIDYAFTIENSRKINEKVIVPIKDAEKSSDAIAYGAKKTLTFYKFLYRSKNYDYFQ